MSITLPEWMVKRFGLTDKAYVKLNAHLCICCDVFFQRVQKLLFDSRYDRRVQNDGFPSIDEKLRDAKGENSSDFPHWLGLTRLDKAVEEGCHICRLFLSQLTKSERNRLASLDQDELLRFTIQLSFSTEVLGPSGSLRYTLKLCCNAPSVSRIDWLNMAVSLFHDLVMLSTQGKVCSRVCVHWLKFLDEFCVSEEFIGRDRWSSAFQNASQWITNCVTNHACCSSPLLKCSS